MDQYLHWSFCEGDSAIGAYFCCHWEKIDTVEKHLQINNLFLQKAFCNLLGNILDGKIFAEKGKAPTSLALLQTA